MTRMTRIVPSSSVLSASSAVRVLLFFRDSFVSSCLRGALLCQESSVHGYQTEDSHHCSMGDDGVGDVEPGWHGIVGHAPRPRDRRGAADRRHTGKAGAGPAGVV